jgi:hypothetical protein
LAAVALAESVAGPAAAAALEIDVMPRRSRERDGMMAKMNRSNQLKGTERKARDRCQESMNSNLSIRDDRLLMRCCGNVWKLKELWRLESEGNISSQRKCEGERH